MLISEQEFNKRYGETFHVQFEQARNYVANPGSLMPEIERERREANPCGLRSPYPDPLAHRMTMYRGFVRYPVRLKNLIMAKQQPAAASRSYLPYIMDIEPNSRCNFRCAMCQVSEWAHGKRADDMPVDGFRDFIESLPYLIEVKLHGMGEPLMHRGFFDMVALLVERDIWTRTSTNGSLLHIRENYRRLVDSGIGEVQLSLDGATKSVYESIRRNGNFERVTGNMTLLNDYANQQGRLVTRMWVVVQEGNKHQLGQFVALAERLGFRRLSFSLSLNDWGQEQWRVNNANRQVELHAIQQELEGLTESASRLGVEATVWRQASKYSTRSKDALCSWVFSRPYISSDLRIVPCCMLGNPDVAELGDARRFVEVWNGEEYRAFRQAHLDGKIPKVCQACYQQNHLGEQNNDMVPAEAL